MFDVGQRIWRISNEKDGLGLCCDETGLFLGNTPLLQKQPEGFAPRSQPELEAVLSRGFGFPVSLNRVAGGLAAVASALNGGNLCRARIAAAREGAAATQEEVVSQERASASQEPPSPFWNLGWGARGRAIHDAMGGSLPWWFKGIDDFRNGIATSFKSIDLNAATYQNAENLASTVNRYVNNLAAFNGKSYAGWEVKAEQITGRALNLIVPRGSMTETQRTVIDAAIERAKLRGINLFVTPF